jgi:hypothetical protein
VFAPFALMPSRAREKGRLGPSMEFRVGSHDGGGFGRAPSPSLALLFIVRAKALDERLHHARDLGIVDAVKIAREAMTNSAAMAASS